MKRGKFEAPRKRRNPIGILFWIISLLLLILGVTLLLKSCNQTDDVQNTLPETQESQVSTTEPSIQPTTEPVTTPPTEPPTTPPTEPATEPATEPTTIPTVPDKEYPPESDNASGRNIVAVAKDAVGKPYAQGGAGPDTFDTSGLISYCFRQCGISVARRTSTLFESGEAVAKEALQPGDVVFFYLETPGKAEYVGIYTGENTFIAVSSSQNAVLERRMDNSYYTEHYVAARRYTPNEAPAA